MSARSPTDDADAALAAALTPYLTPSPVLIAVSGGPDSTALMHVAARLGSAAAIHVATVDHGLRPESADEAAEVGRAASALGLTHHLLSWDGTKPSRGIQAAARAARYALLADCATAIGADTILTGHTADDQAETVLMRLLAGSGPTGLAGMRRDRELKPGLRLVRPFLGIPKADLVAYCAAHGLAPVRDPSNADARFARARLRRLIPDLAGQGLGPERLRRLAARLARDDEALRRAALTAFASGRIPGRADLAFDGRALAALPDAILLRVVDLALGEAGAGGAPRLERLERLVLGTLRPALAAGLPARATLRDILVDLGADGVLRFGPAPPRRTRS